MVQTLSREACGTTLPSLGARAALERQKVGYNGKRVVGGGGFEFFDGETRKKTGHESVEVL